MLRLNLRSDLVSGESTNTVTVPAAIVYGSCPSRFLLRCLPLGRRSAVCHIKPQTRTLLLTSYRGNDAVFTDLDELRIQTCFCVRICALDASGQGHIFDPCAGGEDSSRRRFVRHYIRAAELPCPNATPEMLVGAP